jgi:DNA-binding PadR family transcriptional regulator
VVQTSTLECVLLGLLDQAPRSGYDLRRLIALTPLKRFSDSPGAIYPALRRLERREWVSVRTGAPASGRRRRLLQLTSQGHAGFVRWLRTLPTRDDVVWRMGDLMPRLAFMSQALTRREIAVFLETLAGEVRAYLGELERFRRGAGEMSASAGLAFEAGMAEYRLILSWSRRARKRLAAGRREA